jgi:hypothetical protein
MNRSERTNKRVRYNSKTSSKSITPTQARFALLGQPQLLEGEGAAAYDELFGRLCAAVKPVDIIDEMFTFDVAQLEWEVLRWRRLKWSLLRARGLEALEGFLAKQLNYDVYSKQFADDLAVILQDKLPEAEAHSVQTLACKCAGNEADAVDEVNRILEHSGVYLDNILDDARTKKAKELVQEYVQHNPDTVTQIHELFAETGLSLDALLTHELSERPEYLDYIERFDRLATLAESRRNASLREIERRRAVLGGALRRGVQEVEDAEFKVIERSELKRKDAA